MIMHESKIHTFLSLLLLSSLASPSVRASCRERGIETAVYCSDIIVHARVLDRKIEGTQASCQDLPGATLVLKIESYLVGTGPAEVPLAMFSTWTDPNGHCLYTSIAVVGEDSRPSIRAGDEIVAFLRRKGDQFELLNKCHASLRVQYDNEPNDRVVWVPLQKKEYLHGRALAEYEKTELKLQSADPEEAHQAGVRLQQAFYDRVAVDQLSEIIKMVLKGEGGPRPPTTICY